MSNINRAFAGRGPGNPAFIGFVTGGDPSVEKSEEFILEMIRAGADLVEIGIPFSDPIAEGPVIQRANIRALNGGATVEKMFGRVERLRKKTAVPLVFLTYLNPVFHYGYEKFFDRCREAGLDGIIIPDLPFEEQAEVRSAAAPRGVDLISLAAPTSEERVREIVKTASGFLYLVSSMGVTGIRGEMSADLPALISMARAAAADQTAAAQLPAAPLPVAVGFGIHSPAQAAETGRYADGIIVGSAIVKIVEEHGEGAGKYIYDYVKALKEAAGQREVSHKT
jgi:tryptophan synthase alpha chain